MAASTTLTPTQRSIRARIAAHALHAQGGTSTAAATAASLARFERGVIDAARARGEELTPQEIERRAAHARKSHMTALALRASLARSRKRGNAGPVGEMTGPGAGGSRDSGHPDTA